MRRDKSIKVLLWIILLLVGYMFIDFVINPHYEEIQTFKTITVSNSLFDVRLERLPSNDCICNKGAYIDSVNWANLQEGYDKGKCKCLVYKDKLRFGKYK